MSEEEATSRYNEFTELLKCTSTTFDICQTLIKAHRRYLEYCSDNKIKCNITIDDNIQYTYKPECGHYRFCIKFHNYTFSFFLDELHSMTDDKSNDELWPNKHIISPIIMDQIMQCECRTEFFRNMYMYQDVFVFDKSVASIKKVNDMLMIVASYLDKPDVYLSQYCLMNVKLIGDCKQ